MIGHPGGGATLSIWERGGLTKVIMGKRATKNKRRKIIFIKQEG